ncbi:hypothetical protein PF003_g25518 [Phytophthora fragariae]|nr:hypothetical protein PF003_g25518 [Phytophthora fragariae]
MATPPFWTSRSCLHRRRTRWKAFFLAETLKYHYLLQAPESLIPLDNKSRACGIRLSAICSVKRLVCVADLKTSSVLETKRLFCTWCT